MAERYAVIETATGKVVNVILAEVGFPVQPGQSKRASATASPGDTWDGARFIRPVIAPTVVPPQQLLVAYWGALAAAGTDARQRQTVTETFLKRLMQWLANDPDWTLP